MNRVIKTVATSVGLSFILGYCPLSAASNIPQEIINFAEQNGLELGKSASPIIHKYPLDGKTVIVKGKLSVTGNASFQGQAFPFSVPQIDIETWNTSYIFGKKRANGLIPFKLKHNLGIFTGVMTPTAADIYTLKMDKAQGSILSSLALYGQKSGASWKNTGHSYIAKVVKTVEKGIPVKFFTVTESADFKIDITALPGASANYTYAYDWKTKLK